MLPAYAEVARRKGVRLMPSNAYRFVEYWWVPVTSFEEAYLVLSPVLKPSSPGPTAGLCRRVKPGCVPIQGRMRPEDGWLSEEGEVLIAGTPSTR